MSKQTYWIVGGEFDTHALVTGAPERDRWLREGWAAADEPADGWAYIWREDVPEPGRVPVASLRELWTHRGWVAGPPPGGPHPFAPEAPVEPPAETKTSKPAAGGSAKQQEE